MHDDMYTYHYYKQRSIIKHDPLETYLVHGVIAAGLLFACSAAFVLFK